MESRQKRLRDADLLIESVAHPIALSNHHGHPGFGSEDYSVLADEPPVQRVLKAILREEQRFLDEEPEIHTVICRMFGNN